MMRMWIAKQTAHTKMMMSPVLTAPNPLAGMQRRYRPIAEAAAQHHMTGVILFLIKSPRIGTMTT